MDDDLNAPRAMSAVFGMVNAVEDLIREGRVDRGGAGRIDGFLDEIDRVLGVFYATPGDDGEEELPDDLAALIVERDRARKERNWARADEIRDRFTELGYTLEDTPEGTVWKRS